MRNKLYFYRDKNEFDKLYTDSTNKILPFEFVETKKILENELGNIIDITNMVAFTDTNQANIYSAEINLHSLNENNKIIINKDWYEKALYYFPTIFDEAIPLFDIESSTEICLGSLKRELYYYDDNQFNNLEEYCETHKIPLSNFVTLQNYDNYENEIILDITSIIASIHGSSQLIYVLEQFFCKAKNNIKIIVNSNRLDETRDLFKLIFNECKNISELYPAIGPMVIGSKDIKYPIKIIDLGIDEVNELFNNVNNKLIGHSEFKINLISQLKKFMILNRIGQRKLFSMFLLGRPGLGKTEIGKIISKTLNSESRIIKINFGNYSSQDALNSLIGSPAGYVGCEGGELGRKINSNKVGVIICDEFEKADSEIKNFFLELLEDGRFTDSMSREYDLNGYIVIFTSNIRNKSEFRSMMSPEFESRINLICEFVPLTSEEKGQYVKYQVECCIDNMKKAGIEIRFKSEDIDIKYDDTDDLREIKNRILNKVSEFM